MARFEDRPIRIPIQLTVCDLATGAPVAGARVTGEAMSNHRDSPLDSRDRTLTQADGRATLLLAPGPVRIEVLSSAHARAVIQGLIPESPGADIVLPLDEGETLAGRVVDHAGAPVARARVLATSIPWYHEATVTDDAGTFRFERIPSQAMFPSVDRESEPLRLRVTHPDFAPSEGPLDRRQSGKKPKNPVIVLHRGATLRGRLVRADRTPVAGLEVAPDWPASSVVTGPDGVFVLSGAPLRPVVLTIRRGTAVVTRIRTEVRNESAVLPPEWIVEERRLRLRVQVVDSAWNPLVAARVTLAFPGEALPSRRQTTDARGWAVFESCPPVPGVVLVEKAGVAPACRPWVPASPGPDEAGAPPRPAAPDAPDPADTSGTGSTMRIRLGGGVIAGRLLRGTDRRPVRTVLYLSATYTFPGGGQAAFGEGTALRTDGQGRFTFRHAGPGPYLPCLDAGALGFLNGPRPLEGGDRDVVLYVDRIRDPKRGWIEFEFRDGESYVPVRAVTRAFARRLEEGRPDFWRPILLARLPGRPPAYYGTSSFAPGTYDISLDVEHYRTAYVKKVTIPAGRKPVPFRWLLRTTGVIQGRVEDEQGRPVAGVEVVGWSRGFVKFGRSETDVEGAFRLAGFEAVPVTIRIQDPLRDPVSRTVEASLTEPTDLVLVAPARGAIRLRFDARLSVDQALQVRVVPDRGAGEARILRFSPARLRRLRDVLGTGGPDLPARFRRNLEAECTLAALVPGRYRVETIRDGGPTRTRWVTVESGRIAGLDVVP